MAFDKDNASIITNVVSGTGVIVTHTTDADGIDTFTAEIDQSWVTNNLQASIDAAALARLDVIEAKLGIGSTSTGGSASTTTNTIVVSGDNTTLTADLPVTWKVLTSSGDTAITRTVTVSSGTTIESALKLIGRSINSVAASFVSSVTASGTSADFVMLSAYEEYTLSITASSTADNVVFTVTQ